MKKVLSAALFTVASLAAGMAQANNISDTAVSRTAVKYTCQQGKKITVTYGFNKQKLPVYAEAHVNGKTRHMPINLHRSDNVDTIFGDENNFSLSTDGMTRSNVRKKAVMITSPASEILYKSCKPR
ncbi:adhesin [Neisseria leonii]|uniref:ACP-like domain-containing protein n=1 Tax=Neisseria leonii TaxID=2995413 RepID=UPI00237B6621|nr:adhesin [Neisseria sp. 3986]MDD9326001.1 adhesin [Neisseria sp. 3986]